MFHVKQNAKPKPKLKMKNRLLVSTLLIAPLLAPVAESSEEELVALGAMLFSEPALSINRQQSCASCHQPEFGFADGAGEVLNGAVSPGAISGRIGTRNTPTLTYIGSVPDFERGADGYRGGLFHDGRARDLQAQALQPILNPAEMALPDIETLARRVMANALYAEQLTKISGKTDSQMTPEEVAEVTARALALFQKTTLFDSFDSKYDRYLQGKYRMTDEEELGMTLFFSEQFTNCNQCHQLKRSPTDRAETFTDYSYHNIGVPVNEDLAEQLGGDFVDYGLAQNPDIHDEGAAGKFKVPTLRNVAITAPYMHNGVFEDLETVVRFYNKYNSRAAQAKVNPETGVSWGEPEVAENISLEVLESGPALPENRIKALVAFMKTLTDARYEHLLVE